MRAVQMQPGYYQPEVGWMGYQAFSNFVLVNWMVDGVAGRRERVEGVWMHVDLEKAIQRAERCWRAAGGAWEVAAEAKKAWLMGVAREAARLAVYCRGQGQRGDWLEAAAKMRTSVGARRGALQRRLRNEQVRLGVLPDGRGRWAVDAVVAWRGAGERTEARVRWLGFDRATDRPWPECWVPRRWLTSDLRSADPGRRGPRAVLLAQPRVAGTRIQPKRGGAAVHLELDPSGKRARTCQLGRSRAGGEEDGEAEEEESEVEGEESGAATTGTVAEGASAGDDVGSAEGLTSTHTSSGVSARPFRSRFGSRAGFEWTTRPIPSVLNVQRQRPGRAGW